jgi:hypothetical protein
MLTFVDQAFTMNQNTWLILLALVGAAYAIMYHAFDGHAEAMIMTPFLVGGAGFGRQAFIELGLRMAHDQVVNDTIGMGSGMLAASILAFLLMWMIAASRH